MNTNPVADSEPDGAQRRGGRWDRAARLQHFKSALHALSLQRNVSQADVARATKLGRDSISRYFRGMTLPDPLSLHNLARALDVKPTDLDPGFDLGVLPHGVATAAANDQPVLEVKLDPADPSRVLLRLFRSVPVPLAAQIMALLDEQRKAEGKG